MVVAVLQVKKAQLSQRSAMRLDADEIEWSIDYGRLPGAPFRWPALLKGSIADVTSYLPRP